MPLEKVIQNSTLHKHTNTELFLFINGNQLKGEKELALEFSFCLWNKVGFSNCCIFHLFFFFIFQNLISSKETLLLLHLYLFTDIDSINRLTIVMCKSNVSSSNNYHHLMKLCHLVNLKITD